jgi:hypothetical protein
LCYSPYSFPEKFAVKTVPPMNAAEWILNALKQRCRRAATLRPKPNCIFNSANLGSADRATAMAAGEL